MASENPKFDFIGWITSSEQIEGYDLYRLKVTGAGQFAGQEETVSVNTLKYNSNEVHPDWQNVVAPNLATRVPLLFHGTIKNDRKTARKISVWDGSAVSSGEVAPAQPALPDVSGSGPPAAGSSATAATAATAAPPHAPAGGTPGPGPSSNGAIEDVWHALEILVPMIPMELQEMTRDPELTPQALAEENLGRRQERTEWLRVRTRGLVVLAREIAEGLSR